ncbi:MAG TPA: transposase [Candidatus Limnocylindrales bacterium]|nr:transposase [Candidatus Limnocylindrales bacterium]
MDLPPDIVAALAPFAPLFSDRSWTKAQTLAVGALLAIGRRTVASALRITGNAGERHFTNYHRLLNRDAWSCLAAGQVLLGLILAVLPADAPLVLAADDTIERRNGRRIGAKGCYRDPVRSSKTHPIKCFGLKWVALAVLVPVPWSGRAWALPLLTALSWPAGKGPRRGHKSSIDWARQLVLQVRRWVPERELILVLDGGFAAVELASDCRRHRVTLVCRLRIDAALYDPPAVPPPGRRGPKPKKGPRQPSPKRRAADPATAWESVEVDWYGGRRKALRVVTGTGLWHAPHLDPVPIRHVLTRDPEGQHRDAAYLCTDERLTPERVLGLVVQRWSLEVTFEEARAHLGMETQRQWSDLAIARTTPVLLGLYSVVALLAVRWHGEGALRAAGAAWYAKGKPTFSDCLGAARERIWRCRITAGSGETADVPQWPEPLLDALIHGLSRAA